MHQRWFLLKSILIAAISVAGLSAVQAADEAVDPSGKWSWERDQGGESVTTTLTLELKDGKLTGMMESPMGEQEISEGEIDGNIVAFEVVIERNGLEIPLYFEGKVEGDSIDGFIEVEFAGNVREFPWKPKRVVAEAPAGGSKGGLAGTWAVNIETEDGQVFDTSMVVKSGDDGYTGNFISDLGEAPVEEIMEKDGKVSFTIKLDLGDGQELVSKYNGDLKGDEIAGKLEFDFAGQEGAGTFTAKREAAPADITGTWAVNIETEDGQVFDTSMVVKSGDDGHTGNFISDLGEAPVEDIKLDGKTISFTIKLDLGDGQELVSKYNGEVDGDSIEGKLEFDFAGQEGAGTFTAKREAAKVDLAGTWAVNIETEDGQVFDTSMVVKSGDDGLTGNFISDLGEAPVEEIKLDGNTVSFTIKLDLGDGQELVSKYNGEVDGDSIEGKLEFDFAGQEGAGTFTAKREAAEESDDE